MQGVSDVRIISFEKSKTPYLEILISTDYRMIVAYPGKVHNHTRNLNPTLLQSAIDV